MNNEAANTKESLDHLSDVQIELLNLLHVFKEFCEKHDLEFYASGGTILGAVRHKGFIPWDDDIDLMMPRADYDRLCDVLREQVPEGYAVYKSDELLFGTFENRNIRVTHGDPEWDKRNPYLGIDIFPLDGMPENKVAARNHILQCLFIFALIKLKRIEYIKNTEKLKNREKRPKIEKLLIKYGKLIGFALKAFDVEQLIQHLYQVTAKYDYYNSKFVCYYLSRYRGKEIYAIRDLEHPVIMPFEDTTVKIYRHYDKYLSRIYGEYMHLPPEELRERHGDIRIVR